MARPGGIPGGFPPRRIPGAQSPPMSPYRGAPLDVGLTRGHRAQGDVCAELRVPPRGEGSGVREQASGSSPARPCAGLRGGGRGGRPQPPTRGRCGDCDRAGETGRCRGGLKVGASQAPRSPRGGLSGGAPQRPCWDGEGDSASAAASGVTSTREVTHWQKRCGDLAGPFRWKVPGEFGQLRWLDNVPAQWVSFVSRVCLSCFILGLLVPP